MAEVDPEDLFVPHGEGEDEHPDEHLTDGNDDNTPNGTERLERVKRIAMAELVRRGFKAPADVYYEAFRRGSGEPPFLTSEDKVNWYEIKFGFVRGERGLLLVPSRGNAPAPESLRRKFGLELPHEEETTRGPTEYLRKVFDDPKFDGITYGVQTDGRVWVSLSRTNAAKYFIGEDGKAEGVSGKSVRLPDTLRSKLGKTIPEAMAERDEKIRRNREKEEYLTNLQEREQTNIELRERNEELEHGRVYSNAEMREKNAEIASMREEIRENKSRFEQLGLDILELKKKEEHYLRLIKDLQESLRGTLTTSEKASLTARMQILERENANNIETVNEKELQLRQLARDVDQQRDRIGELERQKEELEATITFQQREIERNNAQIAQNERQIGDNDLDNVERERQELENESEQLEEQNQEAFERLSLKEKVKAIFRKYGLTVFGVLAAVGTIIGVIVSNLKTGLQKVATGVGNGLKEIGKKLGAILPGMIGAIVSFLFKAAGEAVGFLAKNSWLLILLVVTFAVDQFKAKKGGKK